MTRALGADVSKWDEVVDFKKMAERGAAFCFIKASQMDIDPYFLLSWKNAKGLLLRGAYHYMDFRKPTLAQAKLFVDSMGGDWGELPPMLDFEAGIGNNRASGPPPGMEADEIRGHIWNFLDYVEKATGKTPGIYSGYYRWRESGDSNPGWTHFPLWLPWYATEAWIKICTKGGNGAPKPWSHWDFWQYTDRGPGAEFGVTAAKMLDLNYYNGTVEELYARFGTPAVTPPPVALTCPACGAKMPPGWNYVKP